jgi:hypothetical protein
MTGYAYHDRDHQQDLSLVLEFSPDEDDDLEDEADC